MSRSLTSTSTPKDVPLNTSFQSKQKSTIKPDKQLTSNLFGHQLNNQNTDEIYISDPDEKLGNWLPPSVNQNNRRKSHYPIQNDYNRNNTYFNPSPNERHYSEQHREQQNHDYKELKDEITEKVTNHTSKLIDNIENKFKQIHENIERRQEEAMAVMFDRLERTLDDINRQSNPRTEARNTENNNHTQNNRQQESRIRRTNSTTTTEERETTVTEPPLPFYKQLTSMSINEEPQIEQNISSGPVPTTIGPFDGTDPAYKNMGIINKRQENQNCHSKH